MTRRLTFSSRDSLANYLKHNTEGQELLAECIPSAMPHWICTEQGQQWLEEAGSEAGWASVLIVIRGDGYIEAVTDGSVSVKIIQTPDDGLGDCETVEKCEQHTKNDLPLRWQRVWEQGKVQAVYMFKPLTIRLVAARERSLCMLHSLSSIFS